MEPIPTNPILGPIPQHRSFSFPNSISFCSDFDSGNLALVEQVSATAFHLYTAADCALTLVEAGTRTWFHYSVQAPVDSELTITMRNLNNQGKLMREGLKPVTRKAAGTWERLQEEVAYRQNAETGQFEVEWTHRFSGEAEYFAFSYPWSYDDHLRFLKELEISALSASVYLNKVCLTQSCEGRRCDLLTISSFDNQQTERETHIQGLFPLDEPLPHQFTGKRVVFLTARVHPGESPASHMLNGFLRFLFSRDVRARELLSHFVFKVVPMLNPDGVFRGYYRTGVTGANENRFYLCPNREEMPIIWAVKELFCALQGNVACYIDFHAHATKPGCFVFGNHMGDFQKQVETLLFARLLEVNNPYFDLSACSFSEKDMLTRDKGTNLSKEGCGRVVMYQVSRVQLCYTLECNYHGGKGSGAVGFDVGVFERMGAGLGPALLDYWEINPSSILAETLTLSRLRLETAQQVAAMAPYRNYTDVRLNRKSEEGLLSLLRGEPLSKREEGESQPTSSLPKA